MRTLLSGIAILEWVSRRKHLPPTLLTHNR